LVIENKMGIPPLKIKKNIVFVKVAVETEENPFSSVFGNLILC